MSRINVTLLVVALGLAACADSERVINRFPIALLGYDQMVAVNETVMLDASSSFDPEGAGLTFDWALVSRPDASRSDLQDNKKSTNTITIDTDGIFVVELTVSDGVASSSDSLRLFTAAELANPKADAGPDRAVLVNRSIQLDGSASSSPSGAPLTYLWEVVSGPPGHRLSSPERAITQMFANGIGVFVVQLTVADSMGGLDTDTVTLTVRQESRAPTANAGTDVTVDVDTLVTLDGSGSSDPDDDPLTFSWRIEGRPSGSLATLDDATATSPTFTPDNLGTYRIRLEVSDGIRSSSDEVIVTAEPPIVEGDVQQLTFRVTDVEYNRTTDRLVFVSAESRKLVVYDPLTETAQDVPLNVDPTCVSVSPDGGFAAVGHDARVSYVDLTMRTVVKTVTVPSPVDDIVLAQNGYIYARGSGRGSFQNIEIATEVVTPSNGFRFSDADRMRLHSSGERIYGANRGSSPDDIIRIDIAAGVASAARDSPYHGDYSFCGNLWLSRDGARIFTACGNVFRASNDMASDMTYNGALSGVMRLGWVDHSIEATEVVAAPALGFRDEGNDRLVRFYDHEFLAFLREVPLPTTTGGATGRLNWSGRYAFFSGDGSRVFVVVQAQPESSLLEDFGVHVIE